METYNIHIYYIHLKYGKEAKEKAQRLRAFAALAESPASVPRAHRVAYNHPNPSSKDLLLL